MAKQILTQARLKEFLSYNPATGEFTHIYSPSNRVTIGGKAGWNSGDGYLRVRIDGAPHYLHRLAWLYITGEWPLHEVDHINGDPSDNRMDNLRVVTHSNNLRNAKRPRDNTSGIIGVSWDKRLNKWIAKIKTGGEQMHLGVYGNIFDAACARRSAESSHGYHPNHGR